EEDRGFRDAVDIYGANLEKMARLANSYGYGFVVAVQPIVFLKDPLGPTERKFTEDRQRAQRYRESYRNLIQRAATVAKAEGIHLRNLTDVFSRVAGDVFYDTVHFDSENSAVRAALGAEFVDIIRSYQTFRCGTPRTRLSNLPR